MRSGPTSSLCLTRSGTRADTRRFFVADVAARTHKVGKISALVMGCHLEASTAVTLLKDHRGHPADQFHLQRLPAGFHQIRQQVHEQTDAHRVVVVVARSAAGGAPPDHPRFRTEAGIGTQPQPRNCASNQ